MTAREAYQKVWNMSCGEWVPIPEEIRKVLGLDSRLGVYGGVLCTRPAAQGAARLIAKLNAISEDK